MSIEIQNIKKKFKYFQAIDDISFKINKGELVALLGPSGSGKTTLLRIIAGFEQQTSGNIFINNFNVQNKSIKDRKIGFVFQNYALFNNMNVFNNVAFGLKVMPKNTRPHTNDIIERVQELLHLMHLDNFHNYFPYQLSGGQRQRVALARALAIDPQILLLDEPFGALDAKVRKELRSWMRRIHNDMNITSIFVTHDQEEALEVADKIIIMNQGKIEQIGTPAEVYNQPCNAFIYDFLGDFNVFTGWRDEHNITHISEYEVNNNSAKLTHQPNWIARNLLSSNLIKGLVPKAYFNQIKPYLNNNIKKYLPGTPIQIFTRPHEMEVTNKPDQKEYIIATIIHINPAGSLIKLELERKDSSFIYAEITRELFESLNLKKGQLLYVRPKEFKIFE